MTYSAFHPANGLANPHLQTCWGAFFRRLPRIDYRETQLPLPDGDHVWLYETGPSLSDGQPCALLFHGLGGSRNSHYMQGMQLALAEAGMTSIAMDARGAGGRPNEKAYCYHAGSIETIDALVGHMETHFPHSPLFAIGFSIGATQLLNWLIHTPTPRLTAAMGVSACFWLAPCADKLDSDGFFNWRYRHYLLDGLRQDLKRKRQHLLATNPNESETLVMLDPFDNIHTFFEFDEYINAPLHHFADANDYYSSCSPGGHLDAITTPTLLLQAKDDPFMVSEKQPVSGQIGPVTLETTEQGGHVGFVAGSPLKPIYWAEPRLLDYIQSFLDDGLQKTG